MAEEPITKKFKVETEKKDFDPTAVGLSEGFILTDYSRMKG